MLSWVSYDCESLDKVKASVLKRMDNHTEGIADFLKGSSSPMATPNQDPVTSVCMQAPVTPLKPTATKRKLDFDGQLPAKKTQWFGKSSIATAQEVAMNNVCWLSPPQAPTPSQQSRMVADISPGIPSQHSNLYNASEHVIANESSVACERSLIQNDNDSRTWVSDQSLGFGTPELYAVYRNSHEFNPLHGREYMADLIYGIDNQEFNGGHDRYGFPDSIYGNSNAVFGNDWNATYPYISFHACADGFPVRYFQRKENSNISESQTVPTVDSSLAPVTPEKNIQNERQWKRQSLSSTDLYSDERVSQDKQDDPLDLNLSTGIGGTEVCGDQSLPLLLDSSSVTLQSPDKTNQLVTECENEDGILDLNKTPLPKAKRRKHRPKVIREGRSGKRSRAKNLEQRRAKINISEGKRSLCKQHQSEDAILDKETSQKLQEEKSMPADQIVNVTTSVVRESTDFSEEPPTTQSVQENQEMPETEQRELQIQPDELELASALAVRQATLTLTLQKQASASPEAKMSAPQQEVLVSSENKASSMIGNLSHIPSTTFSVKRKPFRENVKMLARKKEKPIVTEKGNLKRNNGLKLQTFPGGVQPEKLSIGKRRSEQDKPKTNNGVVLQTFPGGVQPDNSSRRKRKKKQARELMSKPDNSLCTVSPTLEHEHGVGDQTDTAIVDCKSLRESETNCYASSYPGWNTCVQDRQPPPHRALWPGIQDSIHDSQSSSNLQERATLSHSPQAEPSFMDPVDAIIQRLKQLGLDEKDACSVYKGLEMVPSEGNGELVPYLGNRDMVPYEGPFDPLKKRKARPRVELDAETNRVWRLLMGKASDDDKQPTNEEERERQWQEERKIFRGRVDSFIARMHLVQGDRRFSQWKGSVVDSVVGAFLTQNVSDHLSSSAFISLASRFPLVENSGNATADPDELVRSGLEENTLAEDASEVAQISGPAVTEHIPGHHTVNHKMDEQCMENLRGTANSGESSASNLTSEKGFFTQSMGSVDTSEPICHYAIDDHRPCIPDQGQSLSGAHVHVTHENASITPINQSSDRCGSSSESNSEAGEQTNESTWKKTHSYTKLHSFTELLRKVECRKFWSLEESGKSFRTPDYNDTTSESAQFLDAEYANRNTELNEYDVSNFSQLVTCDSTDDHNCASMAVNNTHPQSQELRQPTMDLTTLLVRQGINTELLEGQRAREAGNKSRIYAEFLNHDDMQAKLSIGMAKECEKPVQGEGIMLSASSEAAIVHTNIGEQHASLSMRTRSSLEAEINVACANHYHGIEPDRTHAPSSELHNHSEICSKALKDHMIDFLGRNSQEESHLDKVLSTQDSSLTEDGIHAAATLWSLAQQGNPESLNPSDAQVTEAPELAQSSNLLDCHTHKDMGLAAPKAHFEDGKFRARKASVRRISGVARANMEMSQGGNKQMFDWESIRKKALKFDYGCPEGKGERESNTKDALNWEAVRCAEVEAIADTIRERGMNNILAGRIKAFLERLHTQHGSIDLEWLKDIPPDDAKDFLLSIRGLGLKSVECIRLLALQHLAFPVDTNVGRICVRLGWVPLQPLPESLQLHLLELYPVLETIQKYLWPRLCTLDQRTLYELHYQMITFGKVFCTKSRPNCNACPMRGDCKHFASAFASARLALPGPTDESSSVANPLLTLPFQQNISTVSPPLALPPTHQELTTTNCFDILPVQPLESNHQEDKCEPIIEEPTTPEHECMESSESAVDESAYTDPDEIPVIHLNFDELSLQLQRICESSMQVLEDTSTGTMSKALVTLSPEAASIPVPKLKNVSRLRTEHRVYELPDHHPLLREFETREADDPCSYLLAIWTPGETSDSIEAPEQCCNLQASEDHPHEQESCSSCMNKRTINDQTVKGTLLIPCRTAMRGSFPLNGTYFQVNEVFADHETSLNPLEVPRSWIWNLVRRTVYFGTSIPTIFRGLSTEAIQYCFWKGYVCVRGFERNVRAPRPLVARLHFPLRPLQCLRFASMFRYLRARPCFKSYCHIHNNELVLAHCFQFVWHCRTWQPFLKLAEVD